MSEKRKLDLINFKITKSSPLWKQFIFDVMEQVVLNILYEKENDVELFEVWEKVELYKDRYEIFMTRF